MQIIRHEKTLIPQSIEGIKFAADYENRLKSQGAFAGREEDTQYIIILAVYYLCIKEDSDADCD